MSIDPVFTSFIHYADDFRSVNCHIKLILLVLILLLNRLNQMTRSAIVTLQDITFI